LTLAAVAVILKPRLVLFPIFGFYILSGMLREFYRLFARGMEKVTGRSNQREETRE
jgi:hypothetical protein